MGQRAEVQRWLDGNRIPKNGVKWFVDKQSGNNLARPAFEELQRAVFYGEVGTIVVWRLDRISRKTVDGLNVLSDWCKRGLRVVSVTQQIDFSGPVGQLIATILFAVGQMEQEQRREACAIGIIEAKKKGKFCGRKRGTTKHENPHRALQLQRQGNTRREIARGMGVSISTAIRYLRMAKKHESKAKTKTNGKRPRSNS